MHDEEYLLEMKKHEAIFQIENDKNNTNKLNESKKTMKNINNQNNL